MSAAPYLLWVALGGTLQADGDGPADRDRYWSTGRTVDPATLLSRIPAPPLPVRVEQPASGASHDLTPLDLLDVVRRLRACDPDEVRGAVVTLGSNALEEAAFVLWLLAPERLPIVVSAAMRPPSALGSDALTNLSAALTLAGSGELDGIGAGAGAPGVVVVSDDAILHPAGLSKSHTDHVDAFRAGGRRLGTVLPARTPEIVRPGVASPLRGAPLPERLAPVAVVFSHLGSDGAAVRAAVAAGARALVVIGLGAGWVPAGDLSALGEARKTGVLVCRVRRTARGRTSSEADDDGDLSAGSLTPAQARLLLAVAIASGVEEPGDLQRLIAACSV